LLCFPIGLLTPQKGVLDTVSIVLPGFEKRLELLEGKSYCLELENFNQENFNQFVKTTEGHCIKHGQWFYSNPLLSLNRYVYYIGSYNLGKKEGKWVRYVIDIANGHNYISSIDEYSNDYLNGKMMKFSYSGLPILDCNFLNGQIDGSAHFYSDEGVLLAIIDYQKGKFKGIIFYKDLDGKLSYLKKKNYLPFVYIKKGGCYYYNIFLANESEEMCPACCD